MQKHFISCLVLGLSLITLGGATHRGPRPGPPLSNTRWTLIASSIPQHLRTEGIEPMTLAFDTTRNSDPIVFSDYVNGMYIEKKEVSGFGVCNRYHASYGTTAEMLVITDISSTAMGCGEGEPEVKEIPDLQEELDELHKRIKAPKLHPPRRYYALNEMEYFNWLAQAERYILAGDHLEIHTANRQHVLIFERETVTTARR